MFGNEHWTVRYRYYARQTPAEMKIEIEMPNETPVATAPMS
jgi:hypothetical protein